MKKVLSIILTFVMLLSILPMSAVTVGAATSGTTGDCTWTLDGTVLTISGNGKMGSYNSYEKYAPWGTKITEVVIENGVTSIGSCAFYNCSSLTGVTIPNSVTIIGDWAFSYCTGLTSVTIPNSVTSINYYAFSRCTSLTSIIIPDNVTRIGEGAFSSCDSLASVTIPDSVTRIGEVAFLDTALYKNEQNWTNDVLYIGNHLINARTDISGDYNIKFGTKTIADKAFDFCERLTGIIIPDSVTSISDSAFYYCDRLKSVTIGDSVTSIGDFAFYGCYRLASVTNGHSVTSIGDYAFGDCYSLKSIIIPESVTSIGDCAFCGCSSLTSITIPDSVTSIGECVFEECESLTSIIVDENNEYYSSSDGVLFNKYKTELMQYPIGNTRILYIIPDSVTSIGEYAFYNCKNLTEITIPDNVTSIGGWAFYNCKNLTGITIPDNVISIGDEAFYCCDNLKSIIIGNSVTSIGDSAFCGCYSLKSIIIPGSVTSIGDYAFYGCYNLTSIIISESVTSIGIYAFYDTALYNDEQCWINDVLYIGNYLIKAREDISGDCNIKFGTKIIADYAFNYCFSLTSITLPYSVKNIGEWAFNDCNNLTDVWYCGNQTDREKIEIHDYNEDLLNATWHYDSCIDKGKHEYFNSCDKDCNKCGTKRTTTHNYAAATCKSAKKCTICGAITGSKLSHKYNNACDKNCNLCGATRTVSAHKYTNACDATCNVCNAKRTVPAHKYTDKCDTTCNVCKAVRKITHTYKTTTTKATLNKDGKVVKKCTVCNTASTTVIYYAKTVKLSATSYTYNGGVKTPAVIVKDSAGKTLVKNTDYTVTYPAGRKNAGTYKVKVVFKGKYSGTKYLTFKINPIKSSTLTAKLSAKTYTYNGNAKKPTVTVKNSAGKTVAKTNYTVTYQKGRKNVGKYKVVIKFKGNYSGTKTLYFTVNPGKTPVKKLTAGKKSLKVAITKKSTQVTGYEVQYSTSKKFTSAKTKTIKSYKTTSVTLKSLKAKKTYYVRVRTYKTVGGKKYYSAWSTAKSKKTK